MLVSLCVVPSGGLLFPPIRGSFAAIVFRVLAALVFGFALLALSAGDRADESYVVGQRCHCAGYMKTAGQSEPVVSICLIYFLHLFCHIRHLKRSWERWEKKNGEGNRCLHGNRTSSSAAVYSCTSAITVLPHYPSLICHTGNGNILKISCIRSLGISVTIKFYFVQYQVE
uniref:Uncharacterized protein n=1 Tax=Poecilia latipinna TaxID=48699 RepID=A0A3B3UYY2_9TELE